jgi:hypothetical protein
MTRFLTLVFLVLALASTIAEARSKRIHVTAYVVEATFTGHPDNIQLGDQHITSVELRDKNSIPVGTGAGVCTIVNTTTEPREQCLITAVFTNGQIIFGGLAPLLEVEAVGHFAILGGTDDFRKVRGEVTIIVTTLEKMEATFDLE